MIRGVSQGVNTQRMNLQRGEEYKLRKVVMIVSRAGRIADFVQQEASSYATGAVGKRKCANQLGEDRVAAQQHGRTARGEGRGEGEVATE